MIVSTRDKSSRYWLFKVKGAAYYEDKKKLEKLHAQALKNVAPKIAKYQKIIEQFGCAWRDRALPVCLSVLFQNASLSFLLFLLLNIMRSPVLGRNKHTQSRVWLCYLKWRHEKIFTGTSLIWRISWRNRLILIRYRLNDIDIDWFDSGNKKKWRKVSANVWRGFGITE